MMTRRRRDVFLIVALTIILGCGAALFFTLFAGWYLTATINVIGVLVLLGLLHYLTWGRAENKLARAPGPTDGGVPDRPGLPRPEDGRGAQSGS